jgi:two-component system sensor histidine kinase KdpD
VPPKRFAIRSYAAAALLVGVTVGAAFVFRRLPHANLSLLFLTVVLMIAARWGLWPSIFASVLSFLALNFFFTQPFHTFAVEEEGDFATLLFFLVMAALTGKLAARMREETAASRAALERVSALLDFSRRMAAASGAQEALRALVDHLSAACDARAVAFKPGPRGSSTLEAAGGSGRRTAATADEREVLEQAWDTLASGGAPRMPGWTLLPLQAGGNAVGMAAVEARELDQALKALIAGLCDQCSIATERAGLVDSLRAAEFVSETERLRSALLSSVSHDLRTPLVSIIGSTSSLLEYGSILKPDDSQELLRTVLDEAQRLNRYIQNLLDMTRFGQQPFELDRQWVDLNDLISSAAERLGSALGKVKLSVDVPADAALLHVQGALIEQVIVNLLDNAAGFAPEESEIAVAAHRRAGTMVIEVSNAGPAIPEDEREKIFDMFYRAELGDRKRPGTGLGLAICRSIVTAHGGTITADTRADGAGALLRVTLPSSADPDGGPAR